MDVQPLAISIGLPGQRKTRTKPALAVASRADRSRWRRRGDDRQPSSVAARLHRPISIIAGLTALAWTTLRVPISPTIDPNLNGTALAGPSGGMLLWIAYGMIGSLRILPAPGGHCRVDVPLPVRGRGDGPRRPDGGRVGRLRLDHRAARAR